MANWNQIEHNDTYQDEVQDWRDRHPIKTEGQKARLAVMNQCYEVESGADLNLSTLTWQIINGEVSPDWLEAQFDPAVDGPKTAIAWGTAYILELEAQ